MAYTIRQSAFETNSSSTHAITVAGEPLFITPLYIIRDGLLTIKCESFVGQRYDNSNLTHKLAFCVCLLAASQVGNINPYTNKRFRLFRAVIRSVLGPCELKLVPIPSEDEAEFGPDYGYIDGLQPTWHQLLRDPVMLASFLFNPQSTLLSIPEGL